MLAENTCDKLLKLDIGEVLSEMMDVLEDCVSCFLLETFEVLKSSS